MSHCGHLGMVNERNSGVNVIHRDALQREAINSNRLIRSSCEQNYKKTKFLG